MLRRLLSAALLNALLLCGWGGVFAAVMCPHAAHAGAHPCCRARLKQKAEKPTSQHCHKQSEASGDAHEAAQNSHDGARLHNSDSHGAEHGAQQISQTSHDTGHVSQPSHGTAHAARGERAEGGSVLEGARAAWVVRSSEGCAHCVGRPEKRDAPAKARSGEAARRELKSRPAPRVQAPTSASFASFAPAVIPVQGSPPTPIRLHALLGVFLI